MKRKQQQPEPRKFDLTIHTDPAETPPAQMAVLFAMLSEAWQLSQKMIDGGEFGIEHRIQP